MDDGLVPVGEPDAIQLEVSLDAPHRRRAGPVGDVPLGVEHCRDLPHCRACGLHLPVQLGELLQRLEDELEQPDGRDERPDLERAAVDQPRPREQHERSGDDAEQLDRREEHRGELLCVDVHAAVRLVEVAELTLEGLLAVERLHDGHARDRLGELGRDGGDPCAHLREGDVRRALEPARHEQPGRQHEECDEPEAEVEQEQPDHRGDQRHRVDDEGRQALVEHFGERVDVARQPCDDPARLLLREVPQRERRQVLEEVAAELEHDALPEVREHQPRRGAEHPRGHADCDVGDDVCNEPALVGRSDAVVDRVADDVPAGDGGCGRDGGEDCDDAEAQMPAVRVPPQA